VEKLYKHKQCDIKIEFNIFRGMLKLSNRWHRKSDKGAGKLTENAGCLLIRLAGSPKNHPRSIRERNWNLSGRLQRSIAHIDGL